jgi:glutamate dehydrogenase
LLGAAQGGAQEVGGGVGLGQHGFLDRAGLTEQVALTRAVAMSSDVSAGATELAAEQAVDAWIGHRQGQVEAMRASVDEIEASGTGWTFAKLTIANGAIRSIASNL